MEPFAFACRSCEHSALDHSSKTGPRDMRCHREGCDCEKYGSWALDAMLRRPARARAMPTPEEIDAARERALAAHFSRYGQQPGDLPAGADAFRAGWEAARFAFFPQRIVVAPGSNLDLRQALLEPMRVDGGVPAPQPGLAGPQLRALADGIRRRFPPPSPEQPPMIYVRNEAMMVLAEGLDDLAHAEDER